MRCKEAQEEGRTTLSAQEAEGKRTKHDELIFVDRQQGAGTEGRIFRQPAALPLIVPKPVFVHNRSMHRKVSVGSASIAVAEAHSALGANGIQCMIMN